MSGLELLTVGRISIDLYCGQLGADWHAATPVLWISGGTLSQEPSAGTVEQMLATRERRHPTVLDLDYRPPFWASREQASARSSCIQWASRNPTGRSCG